MTQFVCEFCLLSKAPGHLIQSVGSVLPLCDVLLISIHWQFLYRLYLKLSQRCRYIEGSLCEYIHIYKQDWQHYKSHWILDILWYFFSKSQKINLISLFQNFKATFEHAIMLVLQLTHLLIVVNSMCRMERLNRIYSPIRISEEDVQLSWKTLTLHTSLSYSEGPRTCRSNTISQG